MGYFIRGSEYLFFIINIILASKIVILFFFSFYNIFIAENKIRSSYVLYYIYIFLDFAFMIIIDLIVSLFDCQYNNLTEDYISMDNLSDNYCILSPNRSFFIIIALIIYIIFIIITLLIVPFREYRGAYPFYFSASRNCYQQYLNLIMKIILGCVSLIISTNPQIYTILVLVICVIRIISLNESGTYINFECEKFLKLLYTISCWCSIWVIAIYVIF